MVVTGSYNWSWSAEHTNDENLMIVHDARLANHYLQEFMARYRQAGGTDSLAVGVDESPLAHHLDLQIGPSPWRGEAALRVRWPGVARVRLYDLAGRLLADHVAPQGEELALLPGRLPTGCYTIVVTGRLGVTASRVVHLGP